MPKAKITTDINNNYFSSNKITMAASVPTTGTYKAGDMVISTSPNSSLYGWICTVAGTPGSWKVLKSATDLPDLNWNNITNKPSTFPATTGTTSTTATRGDIGQTAYNHSQAAHALVSAQRNGDITKAEIEAKLTGTVTTHSHNYAPTSHGNHVPTTEAANNRRFLRNDNTWQDVVPDNIGGFSQMNLPEYTNVNTSYVMLAEVPLITSGSSHCELMIAGQGNFGLTGHSVSLVRLSGRDGGSLYHTYLVDDDSRDMRLGYVKTNNTIQAWLKRGLYDGIGRITVLNKGPGTYTPTTLNSQDGAPSGFTEVPLTNGFYKMKKPMIVNNDIALNGTTTDLVDMVMLAVGSDNNIHLGMNNQCYIECYNTMKVFSDMYTTAGLYTQGLRVNGGAFSILGFGPGNVRIEYSKDGGVVYIAGTESEFYGYGTGFRSNTLQSTESYNMIGNNYFHISPNQPTWGEAGTVWFRNS